MSSFREALLGWLEERTDALLQAPRMWGNREAVEMQALLLFELKAMTLRPATHEEEGGEVFQSYRRFLRQQFPGDRPGPLSELVDEEGSFVQMLLRFRAELGARYLPENPFQHADVVVRLEFAEGKQPSAMSVTGYSDELRRATRAFARSTDQQTGRVRRDIEGITDFTLRDVRVSAPNGVAGEAWVMLERGHPQQPDLFAERQVRRALATIGTTAEWLDSTAPVSDLPIDDSDLQVRAAVQTLRLLPKRDVALVQIGGELLGSARPATLRAVHASRCVQLLSARSEAEPFDEVHEIRAIDLDRGTIALGRRPRITCYAGLSGLGTDIREVGVRARVRGMLYRPHLTPAFVLADEISLQEPVSELVEFPE